MNHSKRHILNTFRFSENLADLFFLLSRHKFSSIVFTMVVNFNAEKRKKKKLKIRKAKCIEYIYVLVSISLILFFLSCSTETKNEVLVLGTIHSGHLTKKEFNIDVLTRLVKEIKPDIILTEIPPNRFQEAMNGFIRDDSISEPRVARFPEYKDVVFPLSKSMNFEIIPTAGWTLSMARERQQKLRAISKDSTRKKDWKEYIDANKKSDSIMELTGNRNDPYFIHTDIYDSIYNIRLKTYNRLFNIELGLGGWDNINIAHYWNIEKALQKYKNQNKRILIIYGAGHKGWFLKELRKRDDITLLKLKPFLDKISIDEKGV